MRWLAIIFPLLVAAPVAHGDVRASLPLQGYYRPGMCMPVRVDGALPSHPPTVELMADGGLPTRLLMSEGQIDAVLPFLAARAIDGVSVNGVKVGTTLRALPDGVRLIGAALPATRPSTAPVSESVIVPLDSLDPVPGPAMAWEAMDELIVDAAGAARIGEERLLALLAHGVDIVAPGEARPAVDLPWVREPDAWALRYEPLGPRGGVFSPAMLPVTGWQPGLPDRVRRQALLAGVLFAILATALAMWRSRRVVIASVALVIVSAVAIGAWRSRQPTIRLLQGTIAVQNGPFTQRDEWRYLLATEAQEPKPLIGARVVAESPDALLEQTSLLRFTIPRGRCVPLLSRTLSTNRAVGRIDAAVTSPLKPLVDAGYVRPGVAVVGQVTHGPWPTIILKVEEP